MSTLTWAGVAVVGILVGALVIFLISLAVYDWWKQR